MRVVDNDGGGWQTRGRLRQAVTAAAAVPLLSTLFFLAPTTGAPTPAAAAAEAVARLIPPKTGPRLSQPTCGRTMTIADWKSLTPAGWTTYLNSAGPGATICFAAAKEPYLLEKVAPKGIAPLAGQKFLAEKLPTMGVTISGARDLTNGQWERVDPTKPEKGWSIGGQTQRLPPSFNGECLPDRPMCQQAEQLFFNNELLRPVDSAAKVEPGTWFFDYAADRIYIGRAPVHPEPTRSPKIETSFVQKAFSSTAPRVTIENMVVEKFANDGHSAAIGGGEGWSVHFTEVRLNHGGGITLLGRAPDHLEGGRATHNYVHHNGHEGITGKFADNVVDSNEISYNNTAGYQFANEGGAGKFSQTTGLRYVNNYVHDNYGMGPWTDGDNEDVTFENNIVDDNDGAGIMHEISGLATIKNNLVRGNGRRWYTHNNAGIFISSSRNTTVTGNTVLVGPTTGSTSELPVDRMGIHILQGVRSAPYCDGPVISGTNRACQARNNSVSNNTIEYTARLRYIGGGAGYSGSGVSKDPESPQQSSNVFEGNSYIAPDCTEQRWSWVVDSTNKSHRSTFNDWRNAGNDATGSCRSTL